MARYFAEINPTTKVVLRVVVADSLAWCQQNLGGTWIETADPYVPTQTITYCGPGYGHDDTWPEKFAPPWRQPEGAHDAYPADVLVFHNGRIWKSLQAANVFEPGVASWRDTPPVGYPTWVQPTGAQDAYKLGDIVTHNGQNWRSTINANVWAPGVSGWEVYVG